MKSKGLGDTIEKVTKATGIKTVVKRVAGDDCGTMYLLFFFFTMI